MKRLLRHLMAGAICSIALAAPAFAKFAESATVYLRADAGSYVGGDLAPEGQTWIHGVDGVFDYVPQYARGLSLYFTGDQYWSFEFSSSQYDPLTNTVAPRNLEVGLYDNARRYPFNSPTRPGMDVSGDGRGYNQLSGWFRVLDVTYDRNNQITSAAIDFAEFGENLEKAGPGIYGSLRFNSDIPLTMPIPEPATYAQIALGFLFVAAVVRRRGSAGRARLPASR